MPCPHPRAGLHNQWWKVTIAGQMSGMLSKASRSLVNWSGRMQPNCESKVLSEWAVTVCREAWQCTHCGEIRNFADSKRRDAQALGVVIYETFKRKFGDVGTITPALSFLKSAGQIFASRGSRCSGRSKDYHAHSKPRGGQQEARV